MTKTGTMIVDQTSTLQAFLDAAAAKQPAPGGGSVAALAGALAASMGEMALNYSIGKKSLAAHETSFRAALDQLHHARQIMIGLMVEDQIAFDALTAARKLPEGSVERAAEYPPALMASIMVPETIGATALAVMEICDRVAEQVNYYLLSDLAVCADLAMATWRCASYNVRVNLASMSEEERSRMKAQTGPERSRATALIQQISAKIWSRFQGET